MAQDPWAVVTDEGQDDPWAVVVEEKPAAEPLSLSFDQGEAVTPAGEEKVPFGVVPTGYKEEVPYLPSGETIGKVISTEGDPIGTTIQKSLTQIPPLLQATAGGQLQALGEDVPDIERLTAIDVAGDGDEFEIPDYLQDKPSVDAAELLRETGRKTYMAGMKEAGRRAPNVPEGSFKKYVADVTVATGLMLPSLAAGVVTKNPNVALAVMYPQVAGQEYGRQRAEGQDRDVAHARALVISLSEIVTEKLPFDQFIKGKGKNILGRIFKAIGLEGGQEYVQAGVEVLVDEGLLEWDMPAAEALSKIGQLLADPENQKKMLYQALVGAGMGGVLGTPAAIAQGFQKPGEAIPDDVEPIPGFKAEDLFGAVEEEEVAPAPELEAPVDEWAEEEPPAPEEDYTEPEPSYGIPEPEAVAPPEPEIVEPAAEERAPTIKPWKGRKRYGMQPVDARYDDLLAVAAKSGGINIDAATSEGIDPAILRDRLGGGKMPVFRKEGGMTIDSLAEKLEELGFIDERDANAALDVLTDAVTKEAAGERVYSNQVDADMLAETRKEPTPEEEAFEPTDVKQDLDDLMEQAQEAATTQEQELRLERILSRDIETPDAEMQQALADFIDETRTLAPKASTTAIPEQESRRRNIAYRKDLEQLTPDEMREAVAKLREDATRDPMTGARSFSAFEDDADLGWEYVGAADMDGMGWYNDNWGHQATNDLLKSVADAMNTVETEQVRFYRLHGDEFAVRATSEEFARSALEEVQKLLASSPVEVSGLNEKGERQTFKTEGLGITYGVAKSYEEADSEANEWKQKRQQRGKRAAKGKEPVGLGKKPAAVEKRPREGIPTEEGVADTEITKQVDAKKKKKVVSRPAQRKAKVYQPISDGVLTHTKLFGDSSGAKSLKSQSFKSLKRDEQHVVLTKMRAAFNDDKIFRAVINTIPVDMMNVLIGKKWSTKDLLHNKSMLTNRLTVSRNVPITKSIISVIDELSAAIEGRPTQAVTKKPSLRGRPSLVELPGDRGAAVKAISGDIWHGKIAGQEVEVDLNPTEAQKEAGNYSKGAISIQGLDITIENPKGSRRRPEWPELTAHYGYIKRTEGADGDHVDVFLGDNAETAGTLFIIDQNDPKTGKFDEHKVVIGPFNEVDAVNLYNSNYEKGWRGAEAVNELDIADFKVWLEKGDTTKPFADQANAAWSQEKPTKYDKYADELKTLIRVEGIKEAALALIKSGKDPRTMTKPKALSDSLNNQSVLSYVFEQSEKAIETELDKVEKKEGKAFADEMQRHVVATFLESTEPTMLSGENLRLLVKEYEAALVKIDLVEPEVIAKPEAVAPEGSEEIYTRIRAYNEKDFQQERVENLRLMAKALGFSKVSTKPKQDLIKELTIWRDASAISKLPIPGDITLIQEDQETIAGEAITLVTVPEGTKPETVEKLEIISRHFGGTGYTESKAVKGSTEKGLRFRDRTGLDNFLDYVETAHEPTELERPSPRPLEGAPAEKVQGVAPERGARGVTERGRDRDRARDERADERGPGRVGGVGAGQAELSLPVARADTGHDYVITAEDSLGAGGAKTKAAANIEAIRLLKQIEVEQRQATPEEQAALVKYVGWGGIPQIFDKDNTGWANEYFELKNTLTSEEYAAARRSTQDAHYTSPTVVKGIFDALHRFGFKHGRILEPSMGTGNFFGMMPVEVRGKSKMTGVELDHITGGIAKLLYPTYDIHSPKGFQEVDVPEGYFDIAIGNPPFGSQKVFDAKHKDISEFSIHNYFFAKSLLSVRRGGVIAMVVSNSLLDKFGGAQRAWLAERARFLGAIRLPNNAFKKNAGTEVTTDIIFLQRKASIGAPTKGKSWADINDTVSDPATGKPIPMNEYFVARPEMMLGEMTLGGTMYRGEMAALIAPEGQNLEKALADAVKNLPEFIYEESHGRVAEITEADSVMPLDEIKVYSYFVNEKGEVSRRLPDQMDKAQMEVMDLSPTVSARMKGLVKLRDLVRRQMHDEMSVDATEKNLDGFRMRLNLEYDRFTKKYGAIHAEGNKRAFRDDPDYGLLQALEVDYDKGISKAVAKKSGVEAVKPSWKKADIFTKRVLVPYKPVDSAETAEDALLVTLAEKGFVDIEHMAKLTGQEEVDLVAELKGIIFNDPELGWTTADDYLSGNVKHKLKIAREAGLSDYAEALEKVQPEDTEAIDIDASMGAPWVPAADVKAFVKELLDVDAALSYQPTVGAWFAKIPTAYGVAGTEVWGTPKANASYLIEQALKGKNVVVRDKVKGPDGDISVINQPKTAAAQLKMKEIKREFADWLWHDQARRTRLAKYYNDTYNTNRVREFKDPGLQFPGMNPAITLRPHQRDLVWRIIQEGRGLLDHVVGAGKTFAAIAAVMEMRRMGLVRKPIITVPNHLVTQWAGDFHQLYPGAKILAATKKDFQKANRQRLFARITTGDWDAIIVAHSSFERVPVPPEFEAELLKQQITDIDAAMTSLKEETGDRISVKQLEKQKDRVKEKMERAAKGKEKDTGVNFAEMGIDQLIVDESHVFKNLFFSTSKTRVAGIGDGTGSQRAFDMFVKNRYLQKLNNGKGTIFLTGTPISNTIAEMYTVQRYLQYDELASRGLAHFDAWANVFGNVVSGWELDATGVNYKMNSRFAEFVNMPELMTLYRSVADVVNQEDLKRQAKAAGNVWPVPDIKGGKPESVIAPRSDYQTRYMMDIVHRAENMPTDSSIDNMLKVTNDARKMALDMRLIDPVAEDFPDSKVNKAVDRVYDIYKKWDSRKGTQLIFSDLSTPKGAKKVVVITGEEVETEGLSMDDILAAGSKFDVYNDIKAKLIKKGIPEAQIRFIHDANTDLQKDQLFKDMNTGKARVLIGSTEKMGTGTNVQRRLVALHHLDAPWRPSDIEQREGRIVRQGNEFFMQALEAGDPSSFEVEVLRYATERTYDARMWQTLEVKAKFIEQLRKGDTSLRKVEDVAGEAANFADLKAAATGNPLILEQVKLAAQVQKYDQLNTQHKRKIMRLQDTVSRLADFDSRFDADLANVQADIKTRDDNTAKDFDDKGFVVTIKGKKVTDKAEAAKRLEVEAVKFIKVAPIMMHVGTYRGFPMEFEKGVFGFKVLLDGKGHDYVSSYKVTDKISGSGMLTRLNNRLDEIDKREDWLKDRRDQEAINYKKAQAEVEKPFSEQAEMDRVNKQFGYVMAELERMKDPKYDPQDMETVLEGKVPEKPEGPILYANPLPLIVKEMWKQAKKGQPLERFMRIPFHIIGHIDPKGVWHAPLSIQKAAGAARGAIDAAAKATGEKIPWLAHQVENARVGLIDRYGLPEDYKKRDIERETQERELLITARDFIQEMERRGMDAREAEVFHSMVTGEDIPSEKWNDLSDEIRLAIDEMGREAVHLGLISEESYQKNKGAYLHRVYLKHEGGGGKLMRWAHGLETVKRKKFIGNELKGRGIDMEVTMEKLLTLMPQDWWGRKMQKEEADAALRGMKFHVFDRLSKPKGETKRKIVERVYWPSTKPVPIRFDAWESRGEYEVRSVGKKVRLWRDFTKAERESMGEILDARYTIGKTFMLMSHDLAVGRFYRDIALNEAWSRKDPPPPMDDGHPSWTTPRHRNATYTDVEWVLVPSDKIPGAAAAKWGGMAGMYVRKEIWMDLNQLDIMNTPAFWRRLMTMWKVNKTARSPVVHMNNVMSNFVFMDMADIRFRDLVKGLREYVKKGKHYEDVKLHGGFGGSFADQELRREVLEPILRDLLKSMEGELVAGDQGPRNAMGVMWKFLDDAYRMLRKVDNKFIDLYQLEDEVFRMATYMRRIDLGDIPSEAAITARDQFLNYDIRAPWVNTARSTVLPFIGYTYRAVPVIAKSLAQRPWKLAKYATVAWMANYLGYMFAPGDEDEERRSMREEVAGRTWLGTYRMIRMPYRDAYGNPVFLDVRRWIPAGDIFDTNQGQVSFIPAPLQFGGPLMIAAEFHLNKVAFTGREIVNPDVDSGMEQAANYADWLWKSWMPSAPWVPGGWYWDKIGRSVRGGRDMMGRPYSLPQAGLSSFGIKVQPHDVQMGLQFHGRRYKKEESALDFQMRRASGDRDRGIISENEYLKIKNSNEKKRQRLMRRAAKTFGQGAVAND